MTRGIIQIAGPVVTLAGILISVWGTFRVTRWYHTFSFADFLRCGVRVTFFVVTGQGESAVDLVKKVAKFGSLNEDRRARSFVGVLMIFAGFVLQAVGAVLWGVDMVWGLMEKAHCP
jgi:hypothetical protein